MITINTFIFNAKDKQSTNSQMQENNFPTFQQVEVIYQMIKKKQSIKQSVRNKPIEGQDIEMQQTSDYLSEIVNEKQYNQGEDFQDFQYDTQDFNDDQFGQDGDNYSQQQNGLSMKQRQKRKQKDRKVRTTITMQRLQQMNRIFKEYQEDKDKGRNPTTNLKEIGNKLKLGYSTILHKFRQFRQNKIVKGGALLESLQKKRKYNKSKDVEKCIEKSLRERPFYTAVQLSKYIFRRFNKSYSRSIISRHLTQMGYSFNNTKPFPLQKNSIKYIEARKMFVKIIQSYVQEDTDFLFIDQVAFSKNLFSRYFTNFHNLNEENKSQQQSDYISLLISANSHKILYYQITTGFFEKQDFVSAIRQTKKIIDLQKKYSMGTLKAHVLLTDIHRIHHDHQCAKASEGSISKTLRELRLRRFFLPPGSPQLNPLESLFSTIRERLSKEGISSQEMLKKKLVQHMGTIYKQPTNVYFKQFKIWMDKAKFGQNF